MTQKGMIPLTKDEKGMLHGGFSLHSPENFGINAVITNVNCDVKSWGGSNDTITNTNCKCSGCSVVILPPDPIDPK